MGFRRVTAIATLLLALAPSSGCVDSVLACRGGPEVCPGIDRLPAVHNRDVEEVMDLYDDGAWGYYLRQVDGSTLARYNANFTFEPASALKTLYLAHALHEGDREAAAGGRSLDEFLMQPIAGTTGEIGSCPLGGDSFGPEPLITSMELMMRDSDNARTHAIGLRFDYPAIESTGVDHVGMADTEMNHVIGCSVPPNQTTLEDLGLLYQAMSNGLLSDEAWSQAREIMLHSVDHFLSAPSTTNQANDFMSRIRVVWKGGHYEIIPFYYVTKAGWLTLPWKVNGEIEMRQYVFGVFVNDTMESEDVIREAVTALLKDLVAQAYLSWLNSNS